MDTTFWFFRYKLDCSLHSVHLYSLEDILFQETDAQELELWSCVPDTASGCSTSVEMATVDSTHNDHSFSQAVCIFRLILLVLVQHRGRCTGCTGRARSTAGGTAVYAPLCTSQLNSCNIWLKLTELES